MPPPLSALATLARLQDRALDDQIEVGGLRTERRHFFYELLRHEQAIASSARPNAPSEVGRILDLAQAAYGDLVGLLVGREDPLLNSARDGEWTLRDILRHAIAVEVRYTAQVAYSATRPESDPVAIRPELLPCDRLSPPDPEYAGSRSGGVDELLGLLGMARERGEARLSALRDDVLSRPSLWGTLEVDVRWRLHQVGAHLVETTVQIEKAIDPRGEARAILRRCCALRGSHERWSPATQRSALDQRYRNLATGDARGSA